MSFKIQNVSATPVKQPVNDYVRPSDWPSISDPGNGEHKFLVCDVDLTYDIVTYVLTGTTAYINWGDGVTDTIVGTGTAVTTTHTYTQGAGTPCSRGYTTFVVHVTTDIGSGLQGLTIGYSTLYEPSTSNVGLLEVYHGSWSGAAGTWISSAIAFNSTYNMLEHVKINSNSVVSSIQIQSIVLGKLTLGASMPNLGTLQVNGTDIRELTIPQDSTILHTLRCYSCANLQSVTLPPTITSSSFNWGFNGSQAAFYGCSSLVRVKMPNIPNWNAAGGFIPFQNLFTNCQSLQSVEFGTLPRPISGTLTAISMANMFQNCFQLQSVYFPDLASDGNLLNIDASSMFSACYSLDDITMPANFNISNASSMFINCYNLKRFRFKSSTNTLLSNTTSMFSSCYQLKDVTLPTAVSGTVNGTQMFISCISLENISLTWNFSTLVSAFTSCLSLKTALITPATQTTTCASYANTFSSCINLESVTLPGAANSCTTIGSMFVSCYKIKSITMPSFMNALVTLNNAFQNCYELVNLTMPSTYGAISNGSLQNIFTNCFRIKDPDLSGITTMTNYTSAPVVCTAGNMTTIKLPSGQSSNLIATTNIGTILSNFFVRDIYNFDKLGSTSTTGNILQFTNTTNFNVTGLTFSCRLSLMNFNGSSATNRFKISRIRHLNTGTGQWGGASPQINISYTNIGYTELVQYFNDIAATGNVVSKTINITGCTGASSLTAADRLILTSKGWTITG